MGTHMVRHTEATDFMCEDCGEQTFTEYPNIRKHIEHSHEEERFSCTVCNNSYTGREQLGTHLARHSETKDFRCDDSGNREGTAGKDEPDRRATEKGWGGAHPMEYARRSCRADVCHAVS